MPVLYCCLVFKIVHFIHVGRLQNGQESCQIDQYITSTFVLPQTMELVYVFWSIKYSTHYSTIGLTHAFHFIIVYCRELARAAECKCLFTSYSMWTLCDRRTAMECNTSL
jgi:hypothetical protein